MKNATVCAYKLPDESKIEEVEQMSGPAKWAVRRNSSCLNKSGEWEWEPRPSERDDEFLARCRFVSPEEAYDTWKRRES